MKTYYISSNLEIYDVISAFNDLKTIDWTDYNNLDIEKDSIVYIYVRPYYNTIAIKAKVIALNINSYDVIDDKKYWVSQEDVVKPNQKYFRLQLVEFVWGSNVENFVKENKKNLNWRTPLNEDFVQKLETLIEKRSLDPSEVFGKNYPNVVKNVKRYSFDYQNRTYYTTLARASVFEKNANLHVCYNNGILIDTSKKDGVQKNLLRQKLNELGVAVDKNDKNVQLLRKLENVLKTNGGKATQSFSNWLKSSYVKKNGEKMKDESIKNVLAYLNKLDSLPIATKYKTKPIVELSDNELFEFFRSMLFY